MATAERQLRAHQVKVCLCQADATEVAQCARERGVGTGAFVRWLAITHIATEAGLKPVRDRDFVKLGRHVGVWFTEPEHAQLSRAAAGCGLTVSAYLGRHVVEAWLRARRSQFAKASETDERRRPT